MGRLVIKLLLLIVTTIIVGDIAYFLMAPSYGPVEHLTLPTTRSYPKYPKTNRTGIQYRLPVSDTVHDAVFFVAYGNSDYHHLGKRSVKTLEPPHNSWCPIIRDMTRHGELECILWNYKKICTLRCHSGYNFDGKEEVDLACFRKENKWTFDVNAKFCASSPSPDQASQEGTEKPDWGKLGTMSSQVSNPAKLTTSQDKVPDVLYDAVSFEVYVNDDYHQLGKRSVKKALEPPHNFWCPIVTNMTRHGELDCILWTYKKTCNLKCHSGYNLNGSEEVNSTCFRKENKWTFDINAQCTYSPSPDQASQNGTEEEDSGKLNGTMSNEVSNPATSTTSPDKVTDAVHDTDSFALYGNDDYHNLEKRSVKKALEPPHNFWCPIVTNMTRHGEMHCILWTYKKTCNLKCHSGYILNDMEEVNSTCFRKENKWTFDINAQCTYSPSPDQVSQNGTEEEDSGKLNGTMSNEVSYPATSTTSPDEVTDAVHDADSFAVYGNDDHHNLEKRSVKKALEPPHNFWCPIITNMTRHGELGCIIWTFKKTCNLKCHSGYNFHGEEEVDVICFRKENKWTFDINVQCNRSSPLPGQTTQEGTEEQDWGTMSTEVSNLAASKISPDKGTVQSLIITTLNGFKATSESTTPYKADYDD